MKRLILSIVFALGCGLVAADAPQVPPEIPADYAERYLAAVSASNDELVLPMGAEIQALRAQVAQLQAQLATAEADKQAAVSKALNDYKASLGAVPFPPSQL